MRLRRSVRMQILPKDMSLASIVASNGIKTLPNIPAILLKFSLSQSNSGRPKIFTQATLSKRSRKEPSLLNSENQSPNMLAKLVASVEDRNVKQTRRPPKYFKEKASSSPRANSGLRLSKCSILWATPTNVRPFLKHSDTVDDLIMGTWLGIGGGGGGGGWGGGEFPSHPAATKTKDLESLRPS
ncbi:hypothetical protein L1887_14015 [Cichorium endivia]|nr:hypothetical protein L1887_14015 [Cichorium endivia]